MGIQNRSCACRLVSGALLLTALCALYSGPPAHAQQDAARASPPPGMALVYVIRIDRQAQAGQVSVLVNAELVGQLEHGTYVVAAVSPGATYLRIGDRLLSTLSFVAAANQSYFVWVEGITGPPLVRTEVNLVSETEGWRAVAQGRLAGAPKVPVAPPVAVTPAPPVAAPPADRVAPAAPAPARDVAVRAEPEGDGRFAIIVSAGSFKLADERQTVAGLGSSYDTTSKSVFGVEAEWRGKSGFAMGAEYFSYKNDLVTTGANPSAQQKLRAIMVNGKYYFRGADWFYPFVGAGVGLARASYGGGLSGDADGLAYQGLVGMEFRFKPVGLSVQYKYFSSKTGDDGREVKVGGSGILAGVSISF
jgi:opacity protein-like surface antigen